MAEKCGCCGASGAQIVLCRPLTEMGKRKPRKVVFCRNCDAYGNWPNVYRATKGKNA